MDFGDPYDEEEFCQRLEEYILKNSPRCFSQVALTRRELPQPVGDGFSTSFQVGCTCGSTSGQFVGHRLEDFSDDYEGDLFITPLSLRCSDCEKVSVIFDTKGHGYHSELDRLEGGDEISQKIRGEGDGRHFHCSSCSEDVFSIFVALIYWHFELQIDQAEMIADGEEESDEVLVRAQDFFNELVIQLKCNSCNKVSIPCEFGKL